MRKFMWKKAAAAAMTATILATSATVLQAAAPPDGYTNAQDTVEAYGGAYSNWMTKWNSTISKDREQISLSPGSDNSSVNFAWYTKEASGVQKLKIAENKRLTNAKVYEAKQTKAVTDKDKTEYVSNKVTATDLKANTNFMDLQNQLKKVEEDIANSRKYYNALVREYNDVIMSVPTNIVASLFHFEKKTMFEVANASERENVQVKF